MALAVVAIAAVVAWLWIRRAGELFCLSVRDGRVLVVRGRIPQALLNDLAEVVARPPLRRGTIRATRTVAGGRLVLSGGDEWIEQRLRNVFRLYPTAQLRAAAPAANRSVGQLLGIAWLAWMLDR